MDTLLLKLVLTPALIGAASLAGRRWGPAVSGWLVALPLTSAPVTFFLAVGQGASFAAAVAAGALAGTISPAGFSVVYGWCARRGWPLAFMIASTVFAAETLLLKRLHLSLGLTFLMVIGGLIAAALLMPHPAGPALAAAPPPAWDLPARMAVATGIVLILTTAAPVLGPHLTGLLTTFPVYASVLAVFAHHQQGPAAAQQVLRGLLLGLFGFASFFLVVAALIEHTGIGPAFAAAVLVVAAVQGIALWVL